MQSSPIKMLLICCLISLSLPLSLSLALPLPSAPGSCHSRTLRLSSSRDRYLHIIIFPSYMRAHTLFLLKYTHSNSLALSCLVIGCETKHKQMFSAPSCSSIMISSFSRATTAARLSLSFEIFTASTVKKQKKNHFKREYNGTNRA